MFRAEESGGIDLAALFNAAPNPYVVFDLDLVIVGCNEAYLATTGRKREEIVGRKLFDAFPSDPQSESGRMLRASLARVIAEKTVDELALIPYDVTLPGQAPEVRYWSATHTPIFGNDGTLRLILQHTTDVTEVERLRSGADKMAQARLLDRAAAVQAQNLDLAEQSRTLRRLFQQTPSFMAVLSGKDHVFTLANDAYAKLTGRPDILGKPLAEALPEVVDQGFVDLLDTVWKTGEPFIGRGVPVLLQQTPGDPPEQTYLDFIYQPIREADGSISGVFVQGHDVTEQHEAAAALRRQTAVLHLAQEAGGVGTFDWNLQTGQVQMSSTFAALYGMPPGTRSVHASAFREIVHPEDRDRLATERPQNLEDGVERTEYRVMTNAGIRWIGRRGTIIRNAAGEPERVVGAVYDLTDRKEQEAHRELMAQETAHRFKNLLATVQAIATQTLRNAPDMVHARDTIGARLVALGQAQDLLLHGSSTAAGMMDVVLAATRLHADSFERFTIHGPNVELPAKTVLAMGLMLHELGTNALKYGALSTSEGRVEIHWREEQSGDLRALEWEWRESQGPAVSPPTRKGFGSRLIERGLASNLGNTVEMDYAPDGLVCRAHIALP